MLYRRNTAHFATFERGFSAASSQYRSLCYLPLRFLCLIVAIPLALLPSIAVPLPHRRNTTLFATFHRVSSASSAQSRSLCYLPPRSPFSIVAIPLALLPSTAFSLLYRRNTTRFATFRRGSSAPSAQYHPLCYLPPRFLCLIGAISLALLPSTAFSLLYRRNTTRFATFRRCSPASSSQYRSLCYLPPRFLCPIGAIPPSLLPSTAFPLPHRRNLARFATFHCGSSAPSSQSHPLCYLPPRSPFSIVAIPLALLQPSSYFLVQSS
ncbi:hypothetical protein BJ095_108125 [Ureibacillus chungkukjangi]|uniref:Uncharacterized protein n=1 Tax=Ureibacillus chungkukjangi TaxID=1202712 RepID=A0A318TQS8_9BACL|nr:hypothetical protein BJ095_108125 [Ureibacillus chungkukjangi]